MIGPRLKLLRIECKLTQEQLAERIGKTQGWVSAVELGQIDPPSSGVLDVLNALNASPAIRGELFKADNDCDQPQAIAS